MDNQIESYYINKSEYGIIHLLVNTKDKWVSYNWTEGTIANWLTIVDEETNTYSETLTIPYSEFQFEKEKELLYLRLEQQNKDQINFYWIPYRLIKGDDFIQRLIKKKNEIR